MKTAKELIFDRFIAPLQKPRANYIGIEIEMPIVNLNGEKTDKTAGIAAVKKAIEHFGFTPQNSMTTASVMKPSAPIPAIYFPLTAPTTTSRSPSGAFVHFTKHRRGSEIM